MKGCEILLNTSFATIEMVIRGFPTLLQLRCNLHSIKSTFKVAFSILTKLGNHHYLIPKHFHHPLPPKISYFPLSLFLSPWQPPSTSCLYGCSIYQYFISFYCWIIFHYIEISHFTYLFISWWAFHCFHRLTIMINATMHTHVQCVLWTYVFNSLRY